MMPVDSTRVSEKFLDAETYLEVLETITSHFTAEDLQSSLSEQLKAERAFEVVLQIMIVICTHIVSIFKETPDSYSQCFLILARKNIVPSELSCEISSFINTQG
jgi:uncharacterized protein YutE (UPF0331/DUF86 family)